MDVLISVTGTQRVDGNEETIRLTTAGSMEPDGGGWKLTYEESAATGMEGVTTVLWAGADEVKVERTGRLHSLLILQKGRRHQCSYDTPYGTLMLGVYTSECRNALTASGGELRFLYTLDMNAAAWSDHDVRISVKEVS